MQSESGVWTITLMGRLKAEREGTCIAKFPTRKAATLLALLALESGQTHERERLAQRLWGSETPSTTRQNLRKALSLLTGLLGPELFETDSHTLRLRPGTFTTDLVALEAARRRASLQGLSPDEQQQHAEEVRALDRGELVPELLEDCLLSHQERHLRERAKWQEPPLATETQSPLFTSSLPIPLPRPLRSLVGRHAAVAALVQLLSEKGTRLVTITGPGGMGKTHLATETARQLSESFVRTGWCSLAELSAPEATLAATARALGVRLRDGQEALTALTEPTLLVLDNAEHLLPGVAAPISSLLERTDRLTCLVTSRLPLGLVGEQEFPLEALRLEDAVLLFQQRVEGIRPQHRWDSNEQAALRRVCVRLDGIPLAIELAASRTRTRSVATLASLLEAEGVVGLRATEPGRPERHRTLRAAIVGSLAQLQPGLGERFTHLGVFAGPFATTAVAALWGCSESEASDSLEELVRHSLTLALPPLSFEKEGRFRLLEPLREVACELLGEQAAVHRRHADYYISLIQTIEQARRGAVTEAPYLWLEAETPNLHAALTFSLRDTPARAVAAILGYHTLAWPWRVRGFGAELASYRYHQRFLERESDLAPEDMWLVPLIRGERALSAGRTAEAEALLEESVRLLEARPEFVSTAPWLALGEVLVERGMPERGFALVEAAAERALRAGEREQAAWALAGLATWLREREEWERWHEVATRARMLENQAYGLPPDAPHPVWDWDLARLEAYAGRWAAAEQKMRQVVANYHAVGWKLWEAGALYEQAFFLERQGYPSAAEPLYQRSIALFEALGEPTQLAEARRRVASYPH